MTEPAVPAENVLEEIAPPLRRERPPVVVTSMLPALPVPDFARLKMPVSLLPSVAVDGKTAGADFHRASVTGRREGIGRYFTATDEGKSPRCRDVDAASVARARLRFTEDACFTAPPGHR